MEPGIAIELGEPDETAAYELIGHAWLAQFGEPWFDGTECMEAHYLLSAEYVGRREFEAALPMLRHNLLPLGQLCYSECVKQAIRRGGLWWMPSAPVVTLAIQRGLAKGFNVTQFSRLLSPQGAT